MLCDASWYWTDSRTSTVVTHHIGLFVTTLVSQDMPNYHCGFLSCDAHPWESSSTRTLWWMEPTNRLSSTFVPNVYNMKKSLTPSNTYCSASKSCNNNCWLDVMKWKGLAPYCLVPHQHSELQVVFLSACKETEMHDRHFDRAKILCPYGNEHEEMHWLYVTESHAYQWAC